MNDLDGLTAPPRQRKRFIVRDAGLPGFGRIYIYDPFGNRLEFLQKSP